MIFGIKTKKDRKIEFLQTELSYAWALNEEKLIEIETLKDKLYRSPVTTVYQTVKPKMLFIEERVDSDLPVEFVKQRIVRQIAEGIEPYVKYEESVDVDSRTKRIKGYLYIFE